MGREQQVALRAYRAREGVTQQQLARMTGIPHLLREGSRHSIYQLGRKKTQVPRHNEIIDELAKKICKDLEIPFVR